MDRPRIVIRRPKKVAHGHHGGSWKIALADFMTALMALFLVMWILSTATAEQRKGVSEYFSTPLVGAIRGGDQTSGSTSVIPGGGPDPQHSDGQRARIDLRQATRMSDRERRSILEQQQRSFVSLQRRIESAIQADEQLRKMREQIRFSLTPEGLLIHLLDSERRPMFELGSDVVEDRMRNLLRTIAPLLNELPNSLSISGHTDSRQFVGGYGGYSNWELSADRANASRQELVAGGLEGAKLLRVQGMADRVPLPDAAARDPENRRIALLVLSRQAEAQIRASHDFEQSVLQDLDAELEAMSLPGDGESPQS